jgi:hypothetical protein
VDYDRSVPDQLRVYLHWRCEAEGTEQNLFLFSQGVTLATARLPKTQRGTYFSTAHDLPAGANDLTLELHAVADEAPSALLGPAHIPIGQRVRLPRPEAHDRYVSLGGQMLLVRAEYPMAVHPGSAQLRTRMAFVALRPITNDYTVSVSLAGEGSKWWAQHDGTPALGAIPTLKWIRGVTIVDEHNVLLPSDATGRGTLYLTVYDAFTMRPLPVLDERLARLGQGTQIELGSTEIK